MVPVFQLPLLYTEPASQPALCYLAAARNQTPNPTKKRSQSDAEASMARATAILLVVASALLLALARGAAAGGGAGSVEVPLGWELGSADAFGFGDAVVRRVLQGGGYIGYGALRRDSVPCSVRGASYYNCRPGAQGNPYSRGCSAITRCRG